jgi:hypothetical protein
VAVEPGKNVTKYLSYKYAFERMKEAIEKEFFLEAIMLAESIIADRLLSYLQESRQETHLCLLIQKWKQLDNQVEWKERINLIDDVENWRKHRNFCAHQVVKSLPGEPTTSLEDFRIIAENCALEGLILARYVCDWRSAQKRKRKI